jgi:hypothetical protein
MIGAYRPTSKVSELNYECGGSWAARVSGSAPLVPTVAGRADGRARSDGEVHTERDPSAGVVGEEHTVDAVAGRAR